MKILVEKIGISEKRKKFKTYTFISSIDISKEWNAGKLTTPQQVKW